jgi:hypothetical protein
MLQSTLYGAAVLPLDLRLAPGRLESRIRRKPRSTVIDSFTGSLRCKERQERISCKRKQLWQLAAKVGRVKPNQRLRRKNNGINQMNQHGERSGPNHDYAGHPSWRMRLQPKRDNRDPGQRSFRIGHLHENPPQEVPQTCRPAIVEHSRFHSLFCRCRPKRLASKP